MRVMILFLLGLSTTSILANENHREVAKQYMDNYVHIAISEMERTRIPASIKLAQGMLESNMGRSELARKANNHFGIKCGNNWSGQGFYREDDDRDKNGKLIKSCFRQFSDAQESYIAHSEFLTDEKKKYRYGFLFEYETTDYTAWAYGLKEAGYATDPKYPQKLISIIEKYQLYRHDKVVHPINSKPSLVADGDLKTTTKPDGPVIASIQFPHQRNTKRKPSSTHTKTKATTSRIKKEMPSTTTAMSAAEASKLRYPLLSTNGVTMVKAKGGETIDQLSARVGISLEDILVYNEEYIQKEEILSPGAHVYLDKKKRRVKSGPVHHVVQEGETMESISQLYGIRLKSLYAKNRMPKGSATVVGQKLFLQETASLDERPRFLLKDSERKHAFLFEDDPTVK